MRINRRCLATKKRRASIEHQSQDRSGAVARIDHVIIPCGPSVLAGDQRKRTNAGGNASGLYSVGCKVNRKRSSDRRVEQVRMGGVDRVGIDDHCR